jgi:dTMP kinase
MSRGYFIALEGIDGTGKSTQARRLATWLEGRGKGVVLTAEPSPGPLGELIRRGLGPEEIFAPGVMALLFAADRLDHLARFINPALAQGRMVISDRYLLSSLAYQSVHNNPDWVRAVNSKAVKPDLTILLDLGVEESLARLEARNGRQEIYERAEFLGQVRLNYLDLAARATETGERVVVIDAGKPAPEVTKRIIQAVARLPEPG